MLASVGMFARKKTRFRSGGHSRTSELTFWPCDLLRADLQRLVKEFLYGLVDGGQDLLECFAAQVSDQTFQSTFNEGAEQLPK